MAINPISVILKQAGLSSKEVEAIEKVIAAQAKDEEWLTPDSLSAKYGFGKSTQNQYRMARKIPYHKISRFIRYKREEIDKWLEAHKVEVA